MTFFAIVGGVLTLLGVTGYWYLYLLLVRRGAKPSLLVAGIFPVHLVALCWRRDLRDLRPFASLVLAACVLGLAALAVWDLGSR